MRRMPGCILRARRSCGAPAHDNLFGWLTHPGRWLWWGAMVVSALPALGGWCRCAGIMTAGFAVSVLFVSALVGAETAWAVWAALFLASALAGIVAQCKHGDVSDEQLVRAAAIATVIALAAAVAAAYLAFFLLVFVVLLWAFVIARARRKI